MQVRDTYQKLANAARSAARHNERRAAPAEARMLLAYGRSQGQIISYLSERQGKAIWAWAAGIVCRLLQPGLLEITIVRVLPLGVGGRLAGTLETRLLSFLDTGVAGQQTIFAQS